MKKILKLKQRHPANRIYLGNHVITNAPTEFDLSDGDLKELQGEGAQAWIVEVKPEPKKEKKKPAKQKEK